MSSTLNWDKQSVIAVIVGAAALFAWYAYGPKMVGEQPAQTPPPAAAVQPAAGQNNLPAAQPAAKNTAPVTAMPAVTVASPDGEAVYSIDPVSGAVEKIAFGKKQLPANDRKDAVAIVNKHFAGAFGLSSDRGALTTVKVLQCQKIGEQGLVLFRLVRDAAGNEFTVMTTYKAQGNYNIQAAMQIGNSGKNAVAVPGLVVSGGDLQMWYQLSGDKKSSSQELHTVEYCTLKGKVKYENANCDSDDWAELNGKVVRWGGTANRFLAQLIKSSEPGKLKLERVVYPAGSKEYIVNANLAFEAFTLAPGTFKTFTFDCYTGPKLPEMLDKFDSEGSQVMHLGWFPIDFLAYIMLKMLNWLYSFVGSFGWSIILLTLLIRTIFFPVTMKANASMREMQALSPKLKEIREKYKDEPMVQQAKMSELYREHKVNPLGGCLPMLIQIPVFIALYYALGSAAELRMQSFWWIKDLAQPDTVATVFGLAINPLIIAWTALMIVQQKLTPTTMDPMQAKVMLAMPLVMVFVLYNLPAALTLYWTVSQMFSIAQMYYQNKVKAREEAARKAQENEKKSDKPKIVRS